MSDAWLELLAAAPGGGRPWLAALDAAGNPDRLLGLGATALRRAGLDNEALAALARDRRDEIARWRAWLGAPGHRLVTLDSPDYPDRLRALPDAPLALWVDGRGIDLLASPQVAVVGSRHPTTSGRLLAEDLARALSGAGITVTSGLAAGIDAAGHLGALGNPGSTIAVLGCGIDRIYPRSHANLAQRIAAEGIVTSEYAPGTATRAFQFPRRNRIIAGLTLGTLVVEANRQSGSLITARLAAEYGREVFAVPGSVHSPLSKGCHRLLRNGATLVESLEDVLVEIADQLAPELLDAELRQPERLGDGAREARSASASTATEAAPWLDFSPRTLDELLPASGLTAAELSSMLLHLEIEGTVEALPGGRYCRLGKRS